MHKIHLAWGGVSPLQKTTARNLGEPYSMAQLSSDIVGTRDELKKIIKERIE